MYLEDGHYFLDLAELIKANQLVRNGVDSEAFIRRFESLNGEQRNTLINRLLEFAFQAHARDDEILEGIARANVEAFAPRLLELLRDSDRNVFCAMADWLRACSDEEKLAAFRAVIEIFGIAEGRVFAAEKKEYCNHWWHRDLLDPLVVKSLLENPRHYMTNMRDDDELNK